MSTATDTMAGSVVGDAWRAARSVRGVVIGVLVVAVVWAAVTTGGFLTASNGKAILASMAFTGLVAIGMTLIMINGNLFSLSLGMTLAVSAMVFMSMLDHGIVVAVLAAVLFGAAMSAAQGWIIAVVSANPIVVTLAAATLVGGLAGQVTGGRSLTPPTDVAGYAFLSRPVAGIPVSVLVMLVAALLVQLWLTCTVTGRRLFLIGTSRPAAVASGVPVVWSTTMAFAMAGVTAGLGGVMLASLNNNAGLSMAGTYNYDAIAAAVVGGAAVSGGRGSILMTIVGALFITTIGDLMLLRGYGTGHQILVKGAILIVFVLLTSRVERVRA